MYNEDEDVLKNSQPRLKEPVRFGQREIRSAAISIQRESRRLCHTSLSQSELIYYRG